MIHLRALEKQDNPQDSQQKEIIKIGARMLVQMQAELEWVDFPGTRNTLELSPATEPSAAVSYC